jgi:hypothetical protein
MSIYNQPHGTAYTADKDYARFTGRIVKQYKQKLGWTDDGYLIARVVTVIDIGRSTPVAPTDGDKQLAHEKLPRTPRATAKLLAPAPPRILPITRMIDLLRAMGPMTTRELAMHMERTPEGVRKLMNRHEGVFVEVDKVRVSRLLWATVWGLVGVHDAS